MVQKTRSIRFGRHQFRIRPEDLASVSWLELYGGSNAAALVNPAGEVEVIQFREVEIIGNQRVRLTGLLRGRRGTDPYVGRHGTGATFLMLDTALIVTELPLHRIGETVRWRAVGSGQIAEEADIVAQEVSARDLKPWAPAGLRAELDAEDNLEINWKRRTRFNGEWRGGSGVVPLNEDEELYRVELLDLDGVVVRVIETQVPQLVYTAGARELDFEAGTETIDIRVAQISSQVGAGFPSALTAAVPGLAFGDSWEVDFAQTQPVFLNGGAVRIRNTDSNTRYSFLLSEAPAAADCEVLALTVTEDTNTRIGVLARAAGSAGSETGIVLQQARAATRLALAQYDNGSFSTFSDDGWDGSGARRLWLRLRLEGSTARWRWWHDGASEPAAWQFEDTVGVTAAGRVGLFAFDGTSLNAYCEYFSAGLDGAAAPEPGAALGADQYHTACRSMSPRMSIASRRPGAPPAIPRITQRMLTRIASRPPGGRPSGPSTGGLTAARARSCGSPLTAPAGAASRSPDRARSRMPRSMPRSERRLRSRPTTIRACSRA